jgi:hypothetical protein
MPSGAAPAAAPAPGPAGGATPAGHHVRHVSTGASCPTGHHRIAVSDHHRRRVAPPETVASTALPPTYRHGPEVFYRLYQRGVDGMEYPVNPPHVRLGPAPGPGPYADEAPAPGYGPPPQPSRDEHREAWLRAHQPPHVYTEPLPPPAANAPPQYAGPPADQEEHRGAWWRSHGPHRADAETPPPAVAPALPQYAGPPADQEEHRGAWWRSHRPRDGYAEQQPPGPPPALIPRPPLAPPQQAYQTPPCQRADHGCPTGDGWDHHDGDHHDGDRHDSDRHDGYRHDGDAHDGDGHDSYRHGEHGYAWTAPSPHPLAPPATAQQWSSDSGSEHGGYSYERTESHSDTGWVYSDQDGQGSAESWNDSPPPSHVYRSGHWDSSEAAGLPCPPHAAHGCDAGPPPPPHRDPPPGYADGAAQWQDGSYGQVTPVTGRDAHGFLVWPGKTPQ